MDQTKSNAESVRSEIGGMNFYIIDFDVSRMTLSKQHKANGKVNHLTPEELDHCFVAIMNKMTGYKETTKLLQHLKDNEVIGTISDKTRDFMLGPNTLRATFVLPKRIMLPSSLKLVDGEHSHSISGCKMKVDNDDLIVFVALIYRVREITEQEAFTVFEGTPGICVAGII